MKKAAGEPLFRIGRGFAIPRPGISETLLREPRASRRTLARLEFRIRFADDVNRALAFHNLAISVAAFGGSEGRQDFHDRKWWLLGPIARANRGAKTSGPTRLVKPFLAEIGIFQRPVSKNVLYG